MMSFKSVSFIHIPKTAGTSFRKAAENYFSQNEIVRNYGPRSPETHESIRALDLKKDQYPLVKLMGKLPHKFYGGHVNFNETCAFTPVSQIVTFIRNPVDQVISHYGHFKRWYGYEKGIEEFVKSKVYQNLQTRYLSSVDITMLGLVGVTEYYDESLELFNNRFGCEFNSLVMKRNEEKEDQSQDLKSLIHSHNKNDIELYEKGLKILIYL